MYAAGRAALIRGENQRLVVMGDLAGSAYEVPDAVTILPSVNSLPRITGHFQVQQRGVLLGSIDVAIARRNRHDAPPQRDFDFLGRLK